MAKRRKGHSWGPDDCETYDLSCKFCGARFSDHLGSQRICPRRAVSFYVGVYPEDPAWENTCTLVHMAHLFVPMDPMPGDGPWCGHGSCGGRPHDRVHLLPFL